MRRIVPVASALVAMSALSFVSFEARADSPARPKPYAVGDTVADFAGKDLEGTDVSLASFRAIPPEKATAAVTAAAAKFGAKDAKPEDPIDGLPGVKKDGAVDPALRLAFVQEAGKP